MSPVEAFILVIRWLHTLAAVAWVGGGLFYLLVLHPALRRHPLQDQGLTGAVAREFQNLVNTAILVLFITGVVLAFDRLASGVVGLPYFITLSVKVALSLWMFHIVYSLRRRGLPAANPWPPPRSRLFSGPNLALTLGLAVFLLSDVLRFLFERGLR